MTDAVRVTVVDTWDEIALAFAPEASIDQVKREALEGAGVHDPPEDYVIKYRGAELMDGTATLAQSGVVPNAALVVLRRRRAPVL